MKQRQKEAHLRAAYVYAALSYCERRKVGCVIVQNNNIIAIGYNGTPPGEDNCCELDDGTTKPNVIHAEANALNKIKHMSKEELADAIVFCTTSPCLNCAEKIVERGIEEVIYCETHFTIAGIEYLTRHGIKIEQINIE